MRERIDIFRTEFAEFHNLEEEHIRTLIFIYDKNINASYSMSEPEISTIGGLLLWVGWLFFNSASGYEIVDITSDAIPTNIAINTIAAASAAGCFYGICKFASFENFNRMRVQEAGGIMNAILAGLVAITASCNNVSLWSAVIIGTIGAIVYQLAGKLMFRWKIDDPIEASQIHGFCGIWGVVAVGIFDLEKGLLYSGSTEQLQI